MDVKCERCNTEYEFDDALVSGRGTTVKCTNCGHKFKIRRGDGDFTEDFWNITTGDGRTLVFTSLRELQRAIQSYLVERNDKLSRGGLAQKPIGQIPELLPFFEQRESAKRRDQAQPNRSVKTQDGIGPAPVSIPPPLPEKSRQPTKPEFLQPPIDVTPTPTHVETAAGATTLIGTGPVSDQPAFPSARERTAPPPPVRDSDLTLEEDPSIVTMVATDPEPRSPSVSVKSTVPMMTAPARTKTEPPPATERISTPIVAHSRSIPPPLPARRSSSSMPSMPGASRPPSIPAAARPPATVPPRQPPRTPPPSPPPPQWSAASTPPRSLRREVIDDDRASHDAAPVRPKRSVGGFVITAIVLGGLVALGAVWAQKNLGALTGKPVAPVVPAADPRAAVFLQTGEKALTDGNLELAKESFDKASALNEKDARTLLDVARLAAVRADVPWLKTRLLPPDATDENRIAKDDLAGLAATAKKTADDALAAAPEDPAALRAKVDALRVAGDREGARALVGRIPPISAQPETAYVLAALDLAEADPLWPTVIERLKTAASAETGPGRARAALVYALARSGNQAAAKAEVDRLSGMTKAHPLLPLLRGLADRRGPASLADAGVDAAAPALADNGSKPHSGGGGGGGGLPSDSRELVTQGERARAKGDYARATTLFNAAVDRNPGDSEALAGLASVAYAQHDLVTARGAYKRVLATNPNYMPALIGLADVEWESGDKATAAKMYKEIADRYPEGTYPARVKQRSEGT